MNVFILSQLVVSLTLASPAFGSYSYHAQRIGSHKGFEVYLSSGRQRNSPVILPALRAVQRYNSIKNLGRKSLSNDIVQTTKDQSNFVIKALEELASNPVAAATIDQVIRDNYSPCLTSLEDGISYLQASNELVDSLGGEFQALTDKFNSLQQLEDPAQIVRETGALLRQIQPLADRTEKFDNGNCPESYRSLALLLTEISEKPELRFKFDVRENLKKASATLSIVNVFNSKLETTIARMKKFCIDNRYNNDAMVAIGDLMLDLSNLYSSLGDIKMGEKFRSTQIYIHRVADQLEKLQKAGLSDSGCVNGDLTKAADIMDELATLIEEVGLEALEKQLGVDLSFNFALKPATTSSVRKFIF